MIYEQHHSLSTDYFTFEAQKDLSFPPHMHACFEIIAVTEGRMSVQVDAIDYELQRGDVIFIFPYQIHRLLTTDSSADTLCVFSSNIISLFHRTYSGKIPLCPVVSLGENPMLDTFVSCRNEDDILKIKGILYLFFAELLRATELSEDAHRKNTSLSLLDKVFSFINRHYKEECTLYAVAEELRYDHTYLSKVFSDFVGMPFHKYIISLRLSDACYLLKNTQNTVLEISQACGFSSLRTFNRNFIQHMNMTPTEYRARR